MKKILFIAMLIGLIAIVPIGAEPGDSDDPLVVLSYLNEKFDELIGNYNLEKISEQELQIAELNTKIDSLTAQIESQQATSTDLIVVTLSAGDTLIAGAGTELILRGGSATAIASANGGLSDVTGAIDIAQDQPISPNHLLIVARDDGRGIYSAEGAILMVRGQYQVTSGSIVTN